MTGILPEITASPFIQNPWKRFANASGETIPPFSVMRITGCTNNYGEITFTVAKPNSTFQHDYLINGPIAVRDTKYGLGTTLAQAGYVAYRSGSGTPAYGEEWGAKNAQWTLEKNRPGFKIEGGIKSTAGVDAIVARQHLVTDLIGKPDSDIAKGATGTVSIYMGAQGAEAVTEYDLTCSALGAAVTGSKWCVVFWRNGVWYVGPWECP